MSFGTTIELLRASGHTLEVRGFINIEGGQLGVSNRFHSWCDCMSLRLGEVAHCKICSREPGDFVSMVSGDGDGIFVVAEVKSAAGDTVGAFVVFDFQYQMANAARSFIEAEKVPIYPIELALQFAAASPIALGSLRNTGIVRFADTGSGFDGEYANVDVSFATDVGLNIFAFAEHVSSDPNDWDARLSQTQGWDIDALSNQRFGDSAAGQAVFEALGIEEKFSLPSFIPRAVMILNEQASRAVTLDDAIEVRDWEVLSAQFAAAVGTSHAQVMHISTVWMNALLAREWDRAGEGELSNNETKRLLFESWTWAYQGAILGDDDCKEMIRANSYRATPTEVSEMLTRRGLTDAAGKAARGELPDIGIGSTPAQESGLLTKSSRGLGAPPMPSLAETVGQARFCSSCGAAFAAASANFCSGCGAARAQV